MLGEAMSVPAQPDNSTTVNLTGVLEKIALGDTDAFEVFYDTASPVLFSIVMQMLRDTTLAEDVIQEVFVQIWERAAFYDALRGKPLTWAISLARNKAIDRLRSLQRRGRLFVEPNGELDPLEAQSPSRDASDQLIDSEGASIIRKALKSLAHDERIILEMAFFSAMTHSEIAEQLGEPLGTIKARIRRSLIKLRSAMKILL